MFNIFKLLFTAKKRDKVSDEYVKVPANEINEDLKSHVIALEKLGEKYSEVIQKEYTSKFECNEKKNLKIWICRDIDGDQLPELTSNHCLEVEYRSQVAINFEGFTDEEDAYVYYIQLWYYFRGGRKGIGTLYDLSKCDLEAHIKNQLEVILREV
ncbi:hypothetical protein NQ126_006620 [Priestia megaterium]|uniref:hypothetical protein n=1 Tax=Priestia megaterium TaxID=1404 RepID=UPI002446775D|nr:hypothetical protein [Priestia megaterium]WRQ94111.1 hypothetical protein NQ126_006620 [Priestia megaterium]